MDWVLALAAVGACVWLASLALGTEADEADRCATCGAPVILADEAVELVKQGVGLRLWANCTACGGSTDLAVEWADEPVWLSRFGVGGPRVRHGQPVDPAAALGSGRGGRRLNRSEGRAGLPPGSRITL